MIDQTEELITSFRAAMLLEDSDEYSSKIVQAAKEILETGELTAMMRLDMMHQLINRWSEVVDL